MVYALFVICKFYVDPLHNGPQQAFKSWKEDVQLEENNICLMICVTLCNLKGFRVFYQFPIKSDHLQLMCGGVRIKVIKVRRTI